MKRKQAQPAVTAELRNVVRCLISFIVRDGKELVPENAREEYVKRYLYRLTKSMNGVNEPVTCAELERYIEEDVNHYMEANTQRELDKLGMNSF